MPESGGAKVATHRGKTRRGRLGRAKPSARTTASWGLCLILLAGGCENTDTTKPVDPPAIQPVEAASPPAAVYDERSVEDIQESTVLLFVSRDYARLESLAESARNETTRLANGGWLLETCTEAFTPSLVGLKNDDVSELFAGWASAFPESQWRAACEAFYWWQSTRAGARSSQERSELGRRRNQALESVTGSITCPQFATERIRRLTSRDSSREPAAQIYAEASAAHPGYGPLIEIYAGWLGGFAGGEVGPWLEGALAGVQPPELADEMYAQVALSRPRSGSDWIGQRRLDWERIQRGQWSLHRRWPGANNALEELAKTALSHDDATVARRALEGVANPNPDAWSNNFGYYMQVRRFAGLEPPPGLALLRETKPKRDERLSAASFSPDGLTLAIGGAKGEISLWNRETGELTWTDRNAHWISAMAFSPDGRWLAVSGGNYYDSKKGGNVRVWDMQTRTVAAALDDLPEQMNALGFSPDGSVLWAGGGKARAQLARWTPGETMISLIDDVAEFPAGAVQALAVGRDDLYLVTARSLWRLPNDYSQDVGPTTLWSNNFSYRALAISTDGSRLAAGTWKNKDQWHSPVEVQIFSTASVSSGPEHRLPVRGTRVDSLAFSPDDRRLLAATGAAELRVWETDGMRHLADVYAGGWMVDALAVAPDSGSAVGIDTSGTVSIWDLNTPAGR